MEYQILHETAILACIEEFKEYHNLEDAKDFLWQMLQETAEGNMNQLDHAYRSNLVFFCHKLIEMFEVIYEGEMG